MPSKFLLFSFSLLVLALTACGTDDAKTTQTEESADVLYNKAAAALDEKNYNNATKLFEEVERQHPYSQWATQSQLMAAYSSYQGQHYDEAVLALDRFIELHPGHKDVDYAHYLRALCYYEQISDVRRDQEMTRQAVESLDTLIRRFPESRYSRDATLKKDLTMDHLAGKEMEVGRYYLERGNVGAAINRFRTVVKDYQTTTHIPEALHRLVEAYMIVGLKPEALRVAAVLGHNYPGSKWYERSYKLMDPEMRKQLENEGDWVDRTLESLFKSD